MCIVTSKEAQECQQVQEPRFDAARASCAEDDLLGLSVRSGSSSVDSYSRASSPSKVRATRFGTAVPSACPPCPKSPLVSSTKMVALSLIRACPRDSAGRLMSIGSCTHAKGACTPCKFACSQRGCRDGPLCGLCHFPHKEMSRSAKRTQIKKATRVRNSNQTSILESLRHIREQVGDAMEALIDLELGDRLGSVKNTFIHFEVARDDASRQRRSKSAPHICT